MVSKTFEWCFLHVDTNEVQELKATLQASLQAKVASLDDDKWMFEKDNGSSQ
jgi:hypothetical protein